MATSFEDNYAEVNGIRLHYVAAGQGDKLIIFAHGFPEFWYAWKDLLSEFSQHYRVVAPDMRGYNLSGKPAEVEQYDVKYMVEDLRALAQHLGFEKFVLVGHDWGGIISWYFAMTHPECLEKLVIVNAPHPNAYQRLIRQNPAQQQASQYILLFRTPKAEKVLSANNYAVLSNIILDEGQQKGYFNEDDRQAYLQNWAQPGALTGSLNYYRAGRLYPTTEAEPETPLDEGGLVNVPTLVIWGEQDIALLPDNLEGLPEYVPQLTVKRIPDGTHWVIHEQPALVSRYIREFIES